MAFEAFEACLDGNSISHYLLVAFFVDFPSNIQDVWLLKMCRNRSWAHCEGLLCDEAARIGDLGRLKWAHEHACPWDEDTCVYAACNGVGS
jgi:hypothetical protein